MSFSTMTKLAFRATSLGALALIILATSANSSFAQFTTTLPTLTIPTGPVYTIPPDLVGGGPPELMTVNIAGAAFVPAAFTGEVDMFELGAAGNNPSDRILFDNTGPGGTAVITFLSDDEFGRLPLNSAGLPYPPYPLLPVAALGPEGPMTTVLPLFDFASLLTFPLTALMISDDENNPVPNPLLGNNSDYLGLSIPEPSTVCLAGLGLAALAGMAYRRRRTRTTD